MAALCTVIFTDKYHSDMDLYYIISIQSFTPLVGQGKTFEGVTFGSGSLDLFIFKLTMGKI